MIWIGIIVVIFIFKAFYDAFKFKDEIIKKQVEPYGGMEKKYSRLIKAFLSEPRSRIIKSDRSTVIIHMNGDFGVSASFIIAEIPDKVQITWNTDLKMNGKYEKRWEFPHAHSQELIVSEIGNYMKNFTAEVFGIPNI